MDFNIDIDIAFILLWFFIVLVAAIIEALTMDLTSIWFALSALVAFLLAIFGIPIPVQFLVFIIISIGLLLSVRPLAKRYFQTNIISTNSDRLVGKTAVCTKEIVESGRGEVKIDGVIWTAISQDGSIVKKDTNVEVLAIEGVKLIVKAK
jgi:membrane protein implicated in regulation of membrane protease activity